jgi:hypothetical protein
MRVALKLTVMAAMLFVAAMLPCALEAQDSIPPLELKEWTQLDNGRWLYSYTDNRGDLRTKMFNEVDERLLLAGINNDLKIGITCQAFSFVCGVGCAAVAAYTGYKNPLPWILAAGSLGFQIASWTVLSQKPVTVTPTGVIVRPSKFHKSKKVK